MRWDTSDAEASARAEPLEVIPTGFGANFHAAWEGSARASQSQMIFMSLADAYGDLINDVEAETGKRFRHPMRPDTIFSDPLNPSAYISSFFGSGSGLFSAMGITEIDQGPIDDFHANLEREFPGRFPNKDAVRQGIIDEYNAAVADELTIAEGADGIGRFGALTAGIGRTTTDLPNAAATVATAPFAAKTILGTVALEAAIGGGIEAATLPGLRRNQEFLNPGAKLVEAAEPTTNIDRRQRARHGNPEPRLITPEGDEIDLPGGEQIAIGAAASGVAGGALKASSRLLFSLLARGAGKKLDELKAAGQQIDPDAEAVLRRNAENLEQSPFEPSRAGDAEHTRRMAEAQDAILAGRPVQIDAAIPDTVTVRAEARPAVVLDVVAEPEAPSSDPLSRLLSDLGADPGKALQAASPRQGANARLATAQGFPVAARLERNAFEELIREAGPDAGDALRQFERFLTEPAELRTIDKKQFLRIRRLDDDPEGRYLVAEFTRRKRNRNEVGHLNYAKIADADEVRRLRRASQSPAEPVERTGGTRRVKGDRPAPPIETAQSARLLTGESAEAIEPLIARTDAAQLIRSGDIEAAQQVATQQADELNSFLGAEDVEVVVPIVDAKGDTISFEKRSGRQVLAELDDEVRALDALDDCARVA